MKLALTLAAGLMAASSFAFAADNTGGGKDNNNNQDNMNTGSVTRDGTGDLEDQQKCREGTGGGAPCQEKGTTMDMQQ